MNQNEVNTSAGSKTSRRSRQQRRQTSLRSSQHSHTSFKDSLPQKEEQSFSFIPPNIPKSGQTVQSKKLSKKSPPNHFDEYKSLNRSVDQTYSMKRPSSQQQASSERTDILNQDLSIVQSDQKPSREKECTVKVSQLELVNKEHLDTDYLPTFPKDDDSDIQLRQTVNCLKMPNQSISKPDTLDHDYRRQISASRNEFQDENNSMNRSTSSVKQDGVVVRESNKTCTEAQNPDQFLKNVNLNSAKPENSAERHLDTRRSQEGQIDISDYLELQQSNNLHTIYEDNGMYGSITSVREQSNLSQRIQFGQRQQLFPSQLSSTQDVDNSISPTPRESTLLPEEPASRPREHSQSQMTTSRTYFRSQEQAEEVKYGEASPNFKQLAQYQQPQQWEDKVDLSPSSTIDEPEDTFQISVVKCGRESSSEIATQRLPTSHQARQHQDVGGRKETIRSSDPSSNQSSQHTFAPPSRAPPTERSGPQATMDYMRIFQGLLQTGLDNQETLVTLYRKYQMAVNQLEENSELPLEMQQIWIDQASTKSFKELCMKLTSQQHFQNQLLQTLLSQNNVLKCQVESQSLEIDQHQEQIQQLVDSQTQEEKLQEQIHEAQMAELRQKYQKQVEILKDLQTSQNSNFEDMLNQQREKTQQKFAEQEREYQAQIQSLEKQLNKLTHQISKKCSNCSKLERDLSQVKEDNKKVVGQLSNTKREVNRLEQSNAQLHQEVEKQKEKADLAEVKKENQQSFKAKYEAMNKENGNLRNELNSLKKYLSSMDREQTEALDALSTEHQRSLDNIKQLHQMSQTELKEKVQEIDDLKVQLQEQIKENLKIEAKGKSDLDQAEKAVLREKKKLKEMEALLTEQESQIQEKIYKMNQLQAQKEQDMSSEWDKNQEQIRGRIQEWKGKCERWQSECASFKDMHQQLQDKYEKQTNQLNEARRQTDCLGSTIRQLHEQEMRYQKQIASLQDEVTECRGAIDKFRRDIQGLEGIDIGIVITRDNQISQPKTARQKALSTLSSLMKSPSMLEQSEAYISCTSSVPSWAQAISQAKIIDKFLKNDQTQKKEIVQLKKNLESLQSQFQTVNITIQKIQEEKSALEKLILEILSFGEQCDSQFDQLQDHLMQFEQEDKSHNERAQASTNRIRKELGESIKTIIVDVQDQDLRDKLLGTLTQLNQRRIDIDIACNSVLQHLISKIQQLQLVLHDQEVQIGILRSSDDAVRESEVQRQLVESKLAEERADSQSLKDNFVECNLIVQNVIKNIKETDQVLKDKTYDNKGIYETKEPAKSSSQDVCFTFDQQLKDNFIANLRMIDDWTHDQSLAIHSMIRDRERVAQLNIKINELAKENSILKIENDKQTNINSMLRDQLHFPSESPEQDQKCRDMPRQLNPTQLTNTEMRSNSKSDNNVLQHLLHRVQHLKENYSDKKWISHPLRLPPDTQTDGSPKQFIDIDVGQMQPVNKQRSQSSGSEGPPNNTYYDLRGSFEFVNQQNQNRNSHLQQDSRPFPYNSGEFSHQAHCSQQMSLQPQQQMEQPSNYTMADQSYPTHLCSSPDPVSVANTENNAFQSMDRNEWREMPRSSRKEMNQIGSGIKKDFYHKTQRGQQPYRSRTAMEIVNQPQMQTARYYPPPAKQGLKQKQRKSMPELDVPENLVSQQQIDPQHQSMIYEDEYGDRIDRRMAVQQEDFWPNQQANQMQHHGLHPQSLNQGDFESFQQSTEDYSKPFTSRQLEDYKLDSLGKIDQINSLLQNQQYLLGLAESNQSSQVQTIQKSEQSAFQSSFKQQTMRDQWPPHQRYISQLNYPIQEEEYSKGSIINDSYQDFQSSGKQVQYHPRAHFAEQTNGSQQQFSAAYSQLGGETVQTYRGPFSGSHIDVSNEAPPRRTHRRRSSGLLTPPIFQGAQQYQSVPHQQLNTIGYQYQDHGGYPKQVVVSPFPPSGGYCDQRSQYNEQIEN